MAPKPALPSAPELLLLDTNLKRLHLPTFIQNRHKIADDTARANLGYDRFLLALTEQEVQQREARAQEQRIKAARFPVLKDLAEFDFSALPALNKVQVLELARGDYIPKAEPILLVGNPGLGKSHLATSLALAACRQGYKVRFYNAAGLATELLQAEEKHQLPRLLAQALKQQVIVIDELGFIPLTTRGAQVFFQFCSALHERVALIVTTNLRFADWNSLFQDERLTGALLDRVTSHAHIVEFVGASYRLRQRKQRGEKGGAA